MVRTVEWSPEASRDLAAIKDRIAATAPATAESVVRQIQRSARGVVTFPYAQRKIPEFDDVDRRETFVHRWRLMYRVFPDRIRVIAVIYGGIPLDKVEDNHTFEEPPQAEFLPG